ncbi:MAG: transketolase family protein [Bacteroidia bacterium]|nr:transketolase family protein [Bacteroidia bacterium]
MDAYKIKEYKPSRFGFGEGLVELGGKYENIIILGADITTSVSLNFFAEKYPERFFSFGIAEQNIAGVAAGLALGGKIPFFSTYGVFAALRTTDQVRVSICYNNLPVKMGGAHAGISVGADGATHQALEDIAIMRALPNMTVLSPCDSNQARLATIASVEQVKGPCYIRFGREPEPNYTDSAMPFEVGKGQTFAEGKDVTIISTGRLTWEAIEASYILMGEGISAGVINIHTIKPVDENIIIKAAKETGAIVTAEEHQVIGGLGSAVAEVVVSNFPVPMEFIGMPDCFGESGKPEELLEKYGMKSQHLVQAVKKVLNRKLTR